MPIPYQRQIRMGYTLYIRPSGVLRGRLWNAYLPSSKSPRLAMPYAVFDHSVEAIAYTLYIGQSGALQGRHLEGLAPSAVFLRYSKQDSVPNHRASLLHTIHGY